ncbi:MAG: putative manganese transporter [Clostridia bacterium]|nr:putative manganese transporter [Clostridia bacterium]
MFDVILDALADAAKDALIIFPFLFLVYTFMEMVENARNKEKIEGALSGEYAPLFASLGGVVPECGFSVMCAKLFDGGLIAMGTLIAAFASTSDEGVIILLSEGNSAVAAGMVVVIKIVYAAFIGVIINALFKGARNKHVCAVKDDCVECGEHHGEFWDKFVLHPFFHAAKTFLYVLAVNVVLNLVLGLIGEEKVMNAVGSNYEVQPLITSLFGLIPNCASSIFLARGFIKGVVSFSGLIAGLTANSGVGMLILLKNRKNIKKSLLILLIMYLTGVVIGYITMPIG